MNNWYDDRECNDMYKKEEKKMICHCKVEEKKPCCEFKEKNAIINMRINVVNHL